MEEQPIGAEGEIKISAEVLAQANLPEGTCMSFSVRADGYILLHRADRDPDQLWYWTEAWQEGEREADADIAAGRVTYFDSDEAFRAALLERMNEVDANI
jgi:hypothetical protein